MFWTTDAMRPLEGHYLMLRFNSWAVFLPFGRIQVISLILMLLSFKSVFPLFNSSLAFRMFIFKIYMCDLVVPFHRVVGQNKSS